MKRAAAVALLCVLALTGCDDTPPNTNPRVGIVELRDVGGPNSGAKFCDGPNLVYTQWRDGSGSRSVVPQAPECQP